MNSYLGKINDFIARLDAETLSALHAISFERTCKKGDFLLRQDEVCKKSFWLEKGIARKFYLHDGKEITTEIYFEKDIAIALDSYCLQKPSRDFIQAITDITVSQTDVEAFQLAKKQFPKLVALDLLMTEYYAMWLEDRLFQYHTLNATSRYAKLVEDHPYVIQNIPLTIIASYLGMSLETLSRIRAKK